MIMGIVVIGICGAYYYVWMKVLPRWGKYAIRSQVDDDCADPHRLVRVSDAEVAFWDASHDELGRAIR
jgi:hypothetical protein